MESNTPTLMKLFGAFAFLAGIIFACLFGIIESQTSGSLYHTSFDVFLGIEIGVTLVLLALGILLFVFGMAADSKSERVPPIG